MKNTRIMNICGEIQCFRGYFVLLLIWISGSAAGSPKLSDTMIQVKAVKDKILSGYDKLIRPTKEGSNTTEVETLLMPRQIIEVDEERGLFILDSYFYMTWKDPRLRYNDTITDKDYVVPLPANTLWRPDITVHNSHSMQVDPTQEVMLLVDNTGTVYWVPPFHTQTSCPSLLEVRYPDEVVTCIITIGSWVHDGWEIDFGHGEYIHLDEFVNINPRWELIVSETKLVRNITFWEGYDGAPYLSLNAMFPMKRRSPPEIEVTRGPCIVIMLFTLSIFWLPTNSSKKVLLGGILFLVLAILLVYVACSTKFPMGVVFATSFLQSTMYILAATLLLQILVIFNICNISGPVRPPAIAMQFLTGPFAKYACLRQSIGNNVPIDRMQLKEDSTNSIESASPREDWMLFAAALDRLFFLIMVIAMIAIHHL